MERLFSAKMIGMARVSKLQQFAAAFLSSDAFCAYSSPRYAVFPGFCDVHVHFREPGFSYKETILSGSRAAAHGGYTAVCTMPNLSPVPDTAGHLHEQLALIEKDACIHVYPYASITVAQKGEKLSDLAAMAENAIAFSDDGRGVQSEALMRAAMQRAKELAEWCVHSRRRICRCTRAQGHMQRERIFAD